MKLLTRGKAVFAQSVYFKGAAEMNVNLVISSCPFNPNVKVKLAALRHSHAHYY